MINRYTESFHLKTSQTVVVDLLRRANLPGLVFPPTHGWTSFLVPDRALAAVVKATPSLMIWFSFAEDFGWEFHVYDGPQLISEYRCNWCLGDEDTEPEVDITKFVPETLQRCFVNSNLTVADFARSLYPESMDDVFEESPHRFLRVAVGLEHTDLEKVDAAKRRLRNFPSDFPKGMIEV